jgi:hypothetical protein
MQNNFLKILIVGFLISIFWLSCQKNSKNEIKPPFFGVETLENRTNFTVTIPWLKQFQSDLKNICLNNAINNVYSIEQAASGVEALLNLSKNGINPSMYFDTKVHSFLVDPANPTLMAKAIYQNSYDKFRAHFLSLDTTIAFPSTVDISIDSTFGNLKKIKVVTTIGLNNSCLNGLYGTKNENGLVDCGDVFEEDEAYFAGNGDKELELADKYIIPMCNWPCGKTPVCTPTPSTAWEEIQNAINKNFPKPANPPGKCLKGFINIEHITNQPNIIPYLFCNNSGNTDGYCMKYDELICNYCKIYELLTTREYPFNYPSDKFFIKLNLAN